ncbi:SnoaL-like domain-containing protein [Amycolatopsis pretoriensis]|uniref:SnoaL-like domain-containing protein n=1 Tax=Amycolatopsis pretoriensis TaxID=218821 RepID=A0A1H5QMV0_9PSEU|nr:nuclear transport factor 2 family protein [Amycolatopsis pretoriensis]SEF26527.1 SnoaL-like domain-containing protein [Amycolatopsis pretoriensis]
MKSEAIATGTISPADRTAIIELLSRYYAAIDDNRLDRAAVEAVFAPDGKLINPAGVEFAGWDKILDRETTNFAQFRSTHHVTGDHIVELDGEHARMRANMIAMHLWTAEGSDPYSLQNHFISGGVFHALAARTSAGWRLSELSLNITWRDGAGPPLLIDFAAMA